MTEAESDAIRRDHTHGTESWARSTAAQWSSRVSDRAGPKGAAILNLPEPPTLVAAIRMSPSVLLLSAYVPETFLEDLAERLIATYEVDVSVVDGPGGGLLLRPVHLSKRD